MRERPQQFFRPKYVGHRGWLGVYLDVPLDWDEVAELVDAAVAVDRARGADRPPLTILGRLAVPAEAALVLGQRRVGSVAAGAPVRRSWSPSSPRSRSRTSRRRG